ncbi:MAG TPA: protein-glutamate O-methyltransferase CheR, partial [Planctomycetes bacterium]|nr:protein-glutamate O-methyltransferase CheR [Planctomycetota bacterium]
YVAELVRNRAAIVLDSGKEYLVEARLAPLAREEGLPNVDALIERLQDASSEHLRERVVDAMTTNETSFFRDVTPFNILRDSILPEIIEARSGGRQLTIWSAACSTGQEPYSIAMLLREYPALAGWNLRILATDFSSEALARAESGQFRQMEVNRGLPAMYLVKYFTQRDAMWVTKPEIRDIIEFSPINLAQPWRSRPKVDVMFLRNVMIYFDEETKRSILEQAHKSIAPDGYLFLGAAETTMRLHDGFVRMPFERACCYRVVH